MKYLLSHSNIGTSHALPVQAFLRGDSPDEHCLRVGQRNQAGTVLIPCSPELLRLGSQVFEVEKHIDPVSQTFRLERDSWSGENILYFADLVPADTESGWQLVPDADINNPAHPTAIMFIDLDRHPEYKAFGVRAIGELSAGVTVVAHVTGQTNASGASVESILAFVEEGASIEAFLWHDESRQSGEAILCTYQRGGLEIERKPLGRPLAVA